MATHRLSGTKLYSIYNNMKRRCNDPTNKRYNRYGGRGITICNSWNIPKNFFDWAMKNGYKNGLQIDRINNDGNYSPQNCRFVTQKENCAMGRRSLYSNNTSGVVGVNLLTKNNVTKFVVQIVHNQKHYWGGAYLTLNEAIEARIKKEIEITGQQRTNFEHNRW